MSFEVFARKDPRRAAKRYVKEMGLGSLDYDWANAKILEGPIPPNGGPELEPFKEDILRGMLTGEIKTERFV